MRIPSRKRSKYKRSRTGKCSHFCISDVQHRLGNMFVKWYNIHLASALYSSPVFGSHVFMLFSIYQLLYPGSIVNSGSWHFATLPHFHFWFSKFYSQSCLGCPCAILLHIFCHGLSIAWDIDQKWLFSDLFLKWLNVILWCAVTQVRTKRKYVGIINLRNWERNYFPVF